MRGRQRFAPFCQGPSRRPKYRRNPCGKGSTSKPRPAAGSRTNARRRCGATSSTLRRPASCKTLRTPSTAHWPLRVSSRDPVRRRPPRSPARRTPAAVAPHLPRPPRPERRQAPWRRRWRPPTRRRRRRPPRPRHPPPPPPPHPRHLPPPRRHLRQRRRLQEPAASERPLERRLWAQRRPAPLPSNTEAPRRHHPPVARPRRHPPRHRQGWRERAAIASAAPVRAAEATAPLPATAACTWHPGREAL
mmetsp:Transcript_80648/g.233208  ORF Transcript_80648/g.233208 Transcript_80648/m.233208 type:complete len:247 (-) Transcript_80648:531-1271(-)